MCDLDGTVLERSGPGPLRPSRGVVDALRWFAAQPLTDVAVVADRPGSRRDTTLAELAESTACRGIPTSCSCGPTARRPTRWPTGWARCAGGWAELDMRLGPGSDLALRHDDFAPGDDGDDGTLDARSVLARMCEAGKGVNLDIKDPDALDAAVAAAGEAGIGDADLWLNGRIDKLGERALREVARAHPDARVQCPAEFLGPLVATMPDQAHAVVEQSGTTSGGGRATTATFTATTGRPPPAPASTTRSGPHWRGPRRRDQEVVPPGPRYCSS